MTDTAAHDTEIEKKNDDFNFDFTVIPIGIYKE